MTVMEKSKLFTNIVDPFFFIQFFFHIQLIQCTCGTSSAVHYLSGYMFSELTLKHLNKKVTSEQDISFGFN